MSNIVNNSHFQAIKNSFEETAYSSLQLSKTNRAITSLDFIMQVQPNWMYYLVYTTFRCMKLAFEYRASPKERRYEVWE